MKLSASLLVSLCLRLQAVSAAAAPVHAAELYVLYLLLHLRTMSDWILHRDGNDPIYRARLVKECGDLGVLDVPAGVPENKVRHCEEHPLSRDPKFVPDFSAGTVDPTHRGKRNQASAVNRAATEIFGRGALKSRDCFYGSEQYEYFKKSCWRVCGSHGSWCWVDRGQI